MFDPALHARTPSLAAVDARGIQLRSLSYHRRERSRTPEARIERCTYDAKSRLHAQWDPRLWADSGDIGSPNQSAIRSLSGQRLQTLSVDAGWRIELFDDAAQAREWWDGRGTHGWTAYDTQRRPVSLHEQRHGASAGCLERFCYGDAGEWARNRCGRTIRHDDPAGSRDCVAYGLSEDALATTQRFLAELTAPDWPESLADRDALLETDAHGMAVSFTTRWRYDGAGRAWEHVDASGHARRTHVDVAGRIVRMDFQPSGSIAMPVVREITYDAFAHAMAETAGNGVVTSAMWSMADGRLRQRRVARQEHLLQDVDYRYDPLGNVTQIEDRAQPTTWFDSAQVDPVSTYTYDTLYQLIEATGRESVYAMIGPALPGLTLPGGGDASRRRNYTQTFAYDSAGNLLTLNHTASDQTQYTRTMAVAPRSNRSLLHPTDASPPDFARGFDANGNQQELDSGAALSWDARNQLQWVRQVVRGDSVNDEEGYIYGGGGMRQRKVRTMQSASVVHVREVRYLPDLELHRSGATGEAWEVASISAGRGTLRWLRWKSNGRKELPSAQWRYSVDDHLGSSTLELDEDAAVVSHEGYYPFGGTAWWAARSEVEASTKTIRYSGKERDSSGLYYYGYRYYAPWLSRWISPDPAGDIDGLNLYRTVRNNPVSLVDSLGLVGQGIGGGREDNGYVDEDLLAASPRPRTPEPRPTTPEPRVTPMHEPPPSLAAGMGALAAAYLRMARGDRRRRDLAPASSLRVASLTWGDRIDDLRGMVDAMHEVMLNEFAQRMSTTAAVETTTWGGQRQRTFAGGGSDLDFAQIFAIGDANATPAVGGGHMHAEVRALRAVNEQGQTPRIVVASRPICAGCQTFIRARGGRIVTPHAAIWRVGTSSRARRGARRLAGLPIWSYFRRDTHPRMTPRRTGRHASPP